MNRALICALAISGFAASAQAADLGGMKDPLPDTISSHGVTLYGTVDVGYAYQTHGAPYSGASGAGLNYSIIAAPKNFGGSISTLTNNALSQSVVGVKIEESLGMGWAAIGKLETGFNPMSGELSDGCASLLRDNGKALLAQTSAGDSSRCGQMINGPAYAGVSNATYGTLTFGRQNTLNLDTTGAYDPMGGSYALALIGFSGTVGGGGGNTEMGRWDNSAKYVYQYGPVHAAGMYANGGGDTGHFGSNYGANAGITWKGLSVDVTYTKEKGAVGSGNFSNGSAAGQCGAGGVVCPNGLAGTITDDETWTVAGKYVYDLGGGWKDEGPSAKVTFFGGYSHIELTNPSVNVHNGDTTIGGYQLAIVNTTPFAGGTSRIREISWLGATYQTGPWAFTAAYYRDGDNAYKTNGFGGTSPNTSVASGAIQQVSGLIDYTVNKHFDIYTGVTWSEASGGLATGFSATTYPAGTNPNTAAVVSGIRLKF